MPEQGLVMRITLLLLAFFGSCQLFGQNSAKKNMAYAEVFGNGLLLSANYERQLSDKPGFGLHLGIGLGGNKPAIPLGMVYLVDLKKEKSFIETGMGVCFAERDFLDDSFAKPLTNEYQAAYIPSLGYRHHSRSGLMWKLIYSPFFSKERSEWLFFGGAVGWRF